MKGRERIRHSRGLVEECFQAEAIAPGKNHLWAGHLDDTCRIVQGSRCLKAGIHYHEPRPHVHGCQGGVFESAVQGTGCPENNEYN